MGAYMKPNWDPEYETFRLYVDACTESSGGSLHSRFTVNLGACENPTGGHIHNAFRVFMRLHS